jgi:ABC-type polysaccharide/polyol phosphate transport system ATPase subunit
LSAPVVVVDRVWKKFRRGERHDSLRDLIPALASRMMRKRDRSGLADEEFWALQDVAFEVRPGEAVGIIGANGAGKSTLLKVLTKILKPTRGNTRVNGRVGALIEIAAGFHPDLTGRENIYLQGAIMGMRRREIAEKLEAIIEFAGTGEFTETPVKRYSSGMNARLGFSIAAHLNPDVLLIDEVLAVGDLAFQTRCYERMRGFKADGVAIAFISHNLSAIASLCDRVVVLNRGRVLTVDRPQAAFDAYTAQTLPNGTGAISGDGGTLTITDVDGGPASSVAAGSEVIVRGLMKVPAVKSSISSGIRVRRVDTGEIVYRTTGPSVGSPPVAVGAQPVIDVQWRLKANLSRGLYYIEVVAFETAHREVIASLTAPQLMVTENESEGGYVHLEARCSTSSEPLVTVRG